MVARFLTDLHKDDLDIWETLKLAGLVLVPAGLVWLQPDTGIAFAYVAILLVVVGALAIPARSVFLKNYQRQRLVSFMNPDADPQGRGYQTIQSQIAIGSGGMTGKGFTKGTQTQLKFLHS